MIRLLLPACAIIALLCVPLGHSAATEASPAVTAYFEPGEAMPIDVLYREAETSANGAGDFYVARLLMHDARRGVLRLHDGRTSRPVLEYAVDVERGIGAAVHTAVDPELDDFFLDNYSEWCGKVHNGKHGKWQLCVGKDCPGGGICIKHCVKVNGTCIP